MTRKYKSDFKVENINLFYNKVLNWSNQFNIFCLLDSNKQKYPQSKYDIIVAVDAIEIITNTAKPLDTLNKIHNYNDWLFGNINFELFELLENVKSTKKLKVDFPIVSFFCPKILMFINENMLTIESVNDNCNEIFEAINNSNNANEVKNKVQLQSKINKTAYLANIKKIKQHLQQGNCYELNYCLEFYDKNASINVVDTFIKLKKSSPTPFQALYKNNSQYLLCASPERFLQKHNHTLVSQPIKGTAKRDLANVEIDALNKTTLVNSQKEISENIMIVDLVRNDLSKICEKKSVQVTELLKIYTYPQVHHLISTIQGTVSNKIQFADIIKACFPMGSMTGAPKKRVLELIESYEASARGLFSGSVGYIAPNGNFDFNVVIRSILYNGKTNYLQYLVGSGITIYCNAESEYEECLLKAESMRQVLE